jgi:hypothetical protein
LRQIERILAFDVARTHIIAESVADDWPKQFKRKVNSGSGTFHVESARILMASPSPTVRLGVDLKKSSGRSAE